MTERERDLTDSMVRWVYDRNASKLRAWKKFFDKYQGRPDEWWQARAGYKISEWMDLAKDYEATPPRVWLHPPAKPRGGGGGNRRAFLDWEIREILRAYQEGVTVTRIAEIHSAGWMTIQRVLEDHLTDV